MGRKSLKGAALRLACLVGTAAAAQQAESGLESITTNGLVYLINTHADKDIDGLLRWESELRSRGLTAMIKASVH